MAPVGWLGRASVVLFAFAAACSSEGAHPVVDGGALSTAPLRSCVTTIEYAPGHSVGSVGAAGEWNQFMAAQTPMSGDSSGHFTAKLTLPIGSYAYKFVVDGNYLLDPTNPYSKYVGGIENSVLEIDDCNDPRLDFVALTKSPDGAFALDAQYVDGATAAGLGQLTVDLDGNPLTVSPTSDGKIHVAATGLATDKHRVTLGATDRAGHAAAPLLVPFWIEAQPFDFRDGALYFAFTDRFRDGDPTNDAPIAGVQTPANYAGGDFAGISASIDDGYFAALGVRSIWISPPNANPAHGEPGSDGRQYSGYHGYWPTAPSGIDSHFGTLDSMKALVKNAHRHGIRILVDSVLNHVHTEHPYYQQHEHDGWFNGDGSCVCGGPNCDWTVHAIDCWFTSYLPDVNYQSFDATKAMVDDALYWAKEVDADGFRVDAVKQFLPVATRRLRSKLHDGLEHAGALYYLVGETFDGDRGLIESFIGPNELLAQFDFPLYFAVRDSIGGSNSMRTLEQAAKDSDAAFGTAPMSPFLGNHDVPRFLTLAANMLVSDGKDQAWTNPPGAPTDETPYQKLRLGLTWVLTQPGVPLIYYGDEFGLPGAADPDNRRMMRFGNYSPFEQATLDIAHQAGAARAALPALQRGNRVTLWIDDDLYIYARVSGQSVALVVLNRSGSARSEAVPVPPGVPIADGVALADRLGGPSLTAAGGHLPLSIPALSSAIYAP